MKRAPIKRTLALAVLLACASQAGAIGLVDAYQAALANDPTFQSAIHEAEAGRENKKLGLSNLLPQASFSYSGSRNRSTVYIVQGERDGYQEQDYFAKGAYLTVKQPLISFDGYARYKQGVAQSLYSESVFDSRKQEMLARVVGAYIEATFAEDQLRLAEVTRTALLEQRTVNERMFDKGESAKTDVLETQAKFDIAEATLLESRDNVITTRNTLAALVGGEVAKVDPLTDDFQPRALQPTSFEEWKTLALTNNPEVESMRRAVEIAHQEINKARAGYLPHLDFVGTVSKTDSDTLNTLNENIHNRSVGIQLNIPIYSGGAVSASTRQAVAQQEKAKSDLEAKILAVTVDLRKQYNAVVSGVTRLNASVKAVNSSKLLVEATRQSVKGGVRINLDLLNAQQQLFTAQRDLAQARYTYLLSYMRLYSGAGILGGEQLRMLAGYFVAAR